MAIKYFHAYIKEICKCALSVESQATFYISYCFIVKYLFESQLELGMSLLYSTSTSYKWDIIDFQMKTNLFQLLKLNLYSTLHDIISGPILAHHSALVPSCYRSMIWRGSISHFISLVVGILLLSVFVSGFDDW